jgi:hypothetical protein
MRVRVWVLAAGVVGLLVGGAAVAALVAWPSARLGAVDDALARVELPGFAGHVAAIDVTSSSGGRVPVALREGRLWPLRTLDSGERLTIVVTERRPGWAGWLIGTTKRRTFTIETPTARLRGRLLEVKDGRPVAVAFDTPVSLVSLDRGHPRQLSSPREVVPVGVVARGAQSAGSIDVAAAARTWERLPAPVRVSWFPARPYPQLLAEPRSGAALAPDGELTLSFSAPVRSVLGTRRPRLTPAAPGHWRLLDEHTLAFRPTGFGFGLGSDVHVDLPRAVHLVGRATSTTRELHWQVPEGSTLRVQELLAQLGYLPLQWTPAADPPATSVQAELADALSPPQGVFVWLYLNTPQELRALWRPGEPNEIVRGAVMTFEHTHDLAVDGLVGPRVWHALIADAVAGTRRPGGYSYVYVHRNVPQSLNLWHNGRVVLTSPGNTGVPAAPTQLGTFPVFEHIPVGTMSGTNPDGSHYHDPGIRWISYFHHGEAIHAFTRSSFGTPQSLGCVELPLDAAAKVWPYTPIGTLVTIEN